MPMLSSKHACRTVVPAGGNSAPPRSGRESAVRHGRADRCPPSIPSGDRRKAVSVVQSEDATGRAAPARSGWSRSASARRLPPHREARRSLSRRGVHCRSPAPQVAGKARGIRPGPARHAASPLIGMRRTFSFATSDRGSVTVSTPLLNVALALSRSIPRGRLMRRSKRP